MSRFRGTCAESKSESRVPHDGEGKCTAQRAASWSAAHRLRPATRSAPPARGPRPRRPFSPRLAPPLLSRHCRLRSPPVEPSADDGRHRLSSLRLARQIALLPLRSRWRRDRATHRPSLLLDGASTARAYSLSYLGRLVLTSATPVQAWPVHKAFCGERAFPVRLPRFRQEDADKVIGIFSNEAALRQFTEARPGFGRDVQQFRKTMGLSVDEIKVRPAPPCLCSEPCRARARIG
jgi:hypothetical protein